MGNEAKGRGYGKLVAICFFLAGIVWLLAPHDALVLHWRAFVLASFCGILVGSAEIISRYRDEPLQACFSPFGLIYVVINGALSLVALLFVFKYPLTFSVASDSLMAALAAGFGAAAVMRTKVAIIKGTDDKDISIGPDFVIRILLRTVDKNVDRFRAERRQAIVVKNLPKIRELGSFQNASEYLLGSLLAFQNLEEDLQQQLRAAFDDYDRKKLPDDLKYLAMGFVFLTLVGESHFESVLENAVQVRISSPSPSVLKP